MKTSLGLLVAIISVSAFANTVLDETHALDLHNLQPFPNLSGAAGTFVPGLGPTQAVGTAGGFFRNFGTNKRTCFSCHEPSTGWTISPETAQKAFQTSNGNDPLFRTNDGSNSPDLDVSTLEAKRTAYSMLLTRGVIRIGLPIPANAEFELSAVDDPYHHASASELSLFRRPLPSQNLKFLSDVMWDGRETIDHGDLDTELGTQANDATQGHAATLGNLSPEDQSSIVEFEKGLFFGQLSTPAAGNLNEAGALGGPEAIEKQNFYVGINDPLGRDPKGVAFDAKAFALFDAWKALARDEKSEARAAVARGEELFNHKTFQIPKVAGLNDVANKPIIQGTCTTCHNTPNVGSNSSSMRFNIGVSDESQRTADLPLYTLKNLQTGEIVKTTDPGRGLISGKWNEIGEFKVPSLRGLAARAPYFHNGSATTVEAAMTYLNARFQIGLKETESADLAAFLKSL